MPLNPRPNGQTRKDIAKRVRQTAADIAHHRVPPVTQTNNGEADAIASSPPSQPDVAAYGTFTKGLSHDDHGRVAVADVAAYVGALNQAPFSNAQEQESPFPGVYKGPNAGRAARFTAPIHDGAFGRPVEADNPRTWESPLSGHTFDLEGADADQCAMPPAPALGSDELTAEMGEVYGAALLRDTPFHLWAGDQKAQSIAHALANLPFFTGPEQPGHVGKRRAARGDVTGENLFRGSTPGAQVGPYISQFLLVGNGDRPNLGHNGKEANASPNPGEGDNVNLSAVVDPSVVVNQTGEDRAIRPEDGFVRYGNQVISQQMVGHLQGVDHMTEWQSWLDVQNGGRRGGRFNRFEDNARFIATPRDLATYVHYDALYQAYLNAALILWTAGAPTDRGLPEGAGHPTRDGFATFGGPHILTLVTEVATRALKAVRRQKFNIHLRSRPEVVAAGISLAWSGDPGGALGNQRISLDAMANALNQDGILDHIAAHNGVQNQFWAHQYGGVDLGPLREDTNALLPMAFSEGSPMHPAYGAGHATVAGACVTILKAFFEMYDLDPAAIPGMGVLGDIPLYDIVPMNDPDGFPGTYPAALFGDEAPLVGPDAFLPTAYEADPDEGFKRLRPHTTHDLISIQGELDKLAANISIGRNFGGVHFYTDYYESVRMGERIAVSILQEQMLTYREPVSMRFTSFDGDHIMIVGTGGSRGKNDALVYVWDAHGQGGTEDDFQNWWLRHA
ncbi:MAG: hypothetical protein AAF376_16350 [Pseudomonadota bacterium]